MENNVFRKVISVTLFKSTLHNNIWVRQHTQSNCSGLQGDLHYHIITVLKLFPRFSLVVVRNSFVLLLCTSCQQTYTHTHTLSSVKIQMLFHLCFPVLCQCISELWPSIFTQVDVHKWKIFSFFLTWEMAKRLVADLIPVTSAAFVVVFLKLCYHNLWTSPLTRGGL